MTLQDISNIRLLNQQITASKFNCAREVVNWMGAIQAQDFSMSKWAVGVRAPGSTDNTIETSFDNGEILRTHLLRPTLHLVSAGDIHWILALTAPRIKNSLKARYKELGLSESLFKKTNNIIKNALKGENHLTREELTVFLKNNKIFTGGQRAYHIIVRAELDGIVCSGRTKWNAQTYALLDERVPDHKEPGKDEGLEEIARKYFQSRGPALLQDFRWWSGLSAVDAGKAIEIIRPGLVTEKVGTDTYLFFSDSHMPDNENDSVHLLPAFDEFLISYKDRSASLPFKNFKKAVSNNGIFRPVIVIGGKVEGTWKRTVNKEKVLIETYLFEHKNKSVNDRIDKRVEAYGLFTGKKTEIKHISG